MEVTHINRTLSLTFGLFNRKTAAPCIRRQDEQAANERELLQRASQGDREALGVIYDIHSPAVFRLLLALLGTREDAEDALQDVFVKLVEGRMKGAHNLRAFLLTTGRRTAYDILRRRKHEVGIEECSDLLNAPQHNLDDWTCVLNCLPLEQREIVVLKVYEQMTFAEIAKLLKLPQNTVASRYRYAIEKLRHWLNEEERDA